MYIKKCACKTVTHTVAAKLSVWHQLAILLHAVLSLHPPLWSKRAWHKPQIFNMPKSLPNTSLWRDAEMKYVQVLLKKIGGKQVFATPLHWIEHLLLLRGCATAVLIIRRRLPANVALNKLFQSVVALSKQVLKVPAPRLGFLQKRTDGKAPSHPLDIWRSPLSEQSPFIFDM